MGPRVGPGECSCFVQCLPVDGSRVIRRWADFTGAPIIVCKSVGHVLAAGTISNAGHVGLALSRYRAIEEADSFQALCRRILKWGGLTLLAMVAFGLTMDLLEPQFWVEDNARMAEEDHLEALAEQQLAAGSTEVSRYTGIP